MNAIPLSLWSVHPWSEVHCPQVDLKHHQLWACWLWQVVLCWGPGDPSLSPLDAVSHSDEGDIRSRSCHDGKGICTACTSFNSLYLDRDAWIYPHLSEYTHGQIQAPSLVWEHTLHTPVIYEYKVGSGEKRTNSLYLMSTAQVADHNVLKSVFV